MKEILGKNLQCFFDNKQLEGRKTYAGKEFEVWEIPNETYEIMCGMTDDEWYNLYPTSEWAFAKGSNMGTPNVDYIINGQHIIAWDGETRINWRNDECEDCSDYLEGRCNANEEDVLACCRERKYNSITQYLEDEISVGLLRNVCALATDLAKYNNMTLGELFTKFER